VVARVRHRGGSHDLRPAAVEPDLRVDDPVQRIVRLHHGDGLAVSRAPRAAATPDAAAHHHQALARAHVADEEVEVRGLVVVHGEEVHRAGPHLRGHLELEAEGRQPHPQGGGEPLQQGRHRLQTLRVPWQVLRVAGEAAARMGEAALVDGHHWGPRGRVSLA
jgi:hypothetical protein